MSLTAELWCECDPRLVLISLCSHKQNILPDFLINTSLFPSLRGDISSHYSAIGENNSSKPRSSNCNHQHLHIFLCSPGRRFMKITDIIFLSSDHLLLFNSNREGHGANRKCQKYNLCWQLTNICSFFRFWIGQQGILDSQNTLTSLNYDRYQPKNVLDNSFYHIHQP